ncbi:MAG: succinylglutamate desuccinylase, partial [Shimia sp.]|nr:succinylglutamate desuccinylase [Shimia sp.]
APAIKAGRRTSPIDDLNLARAFPGDPDGTPTRQIAHYVARELLPRADFVLDLHAGGSSLEIMTVALLRRHEDMDLDARNEAAMRSFGAPMALAGASSEQRTLIAAAAKQSKVAFAVELGRAGSVSPAALTIARAGLVGFLAHTGIMPGGVTPYMGPLWHVAGKDAFVYAPADGVFEPIHALGDNVAAGQLAGCIHDLSRPAESPTPVRFGLGGLMFARRAPGIVAAGNCLVSTGCFPAGCSLFQSINESETG